MGRQKVILEKMARIFHVRNVLIRQALAECLGTLILVMFGCGAVAQLILSGGSHGMFLTVNFAFGFAATLGILVCGQVSGGHINPTVTFSLCLLGREPWRKFPVFFLAQTLGAFLGSGIIFGMYIDAIWDYGQGSLVVVGDNATAGIFATYPSKHLTLLNGFFDQVRQENQHSLKIFLRMSQYFGCILQVLFWTPMTLLWTKTAETSSEYHLPCCTEKLTFYNNMRV
ncbi:hypothetical protein cypCar_00002426 [Cyprinus carpio]|nr:hypothetical protein cypCar_00002426 [Cyprinus carpio]